MMATAHREETVRPGIAGFTFRLPPGFRDLPGLRGDTSWAAIRDAGDREVLVRLRGALAALGIVHASVHTLRPGETATSASLLVAVLPGSYGNANEIAADLVASLAGRNDGGAEARLLRLPCGSAVGVVAEHPVRLEAMPPLKMAEYRAYIPVPVHGWLLTVTLSTTRAPGW